MEPSRSPGAPPGDPLFQGDERVETSSKRATLLFQFFLFPLLIVVAALGVFLFFGAIGGSEKSPREFLQDVASGGENVQKQGAQQLAVALQKERQRVRDGEIPLEKAFYVDPAFRRDLKEAFVQSFPDRSAERQVFLAAALGFVGDPAYLEVLAPKMSADQPEDLRVAVAKAIADLDPLSDADVAAVVEALSRLVGDGYEPVRNYAVFGLSRHEGAGSRAALRTALADTSVFVRVNAAAALAVMKEDPGADVLGNLLDPKWVEATIRFDAPFRRQAGGDPPEDRCLELRRAALSNGIRGALALRTAALRPKIEALTRDRDSEVKNLALAALDAWPAPR